MAANGTVLSQTSLTVPPCGNLIRGSGGRKRAELVLLDLRTEKAAIDRVLDWIRDGMSGNLELRGGDQPALAFDRLVYTPGSPPRSAAALGAAAGSGNDNHRHADGVVSATCARVPGCETGVVLFGGQRHQRVIDGAARDTKAAQHVWQLPAA